MSRRRTRKPETGPRYEGPGVCPKCGGMVVRDDYAGMVSAYCVICGAREDHPRNYYKPRPVKGRLDALVQCVVQGCTGMVQVSTTKNGLCTKCNRLMADWEKSAKTRPAPLVCVAGVWIFNPEAKERQCAPNHKRKSRKAVEDGGHGNS